MVPKKKRRPNWKAKALLLIFFAGIAGAAFFTSPLSEVHSVTVQGNQQVPADQIKQISGIYTGMNFWDVKPDEIDQRLKSQIPLIAKTDVEVNFPGNVVIAVAEKPVSAIFVAKGGTYYRLLSDGTVFDTVSNLNGTSIPLLYSERTIKVEVGKRIEDPDIQKFCEQILSVDREMLSIISDFQISEDKLWTAVTQEHFEIRFPPSDISKVLATYTKFWKKQLENKPPGIIYIYPDEDLAWYQPKGTQ